MLVRAFEARLYLRQRFYMDNRILIRELGQAVARFEEAMEISTDDDLMKAGCIQYFEFSFELAWKTIKQIANDQGVADCNSPKSSLKYAFKNSWLDDEEIWLDMLSSRNKMSHTYNASTALNVYDKLSSFVEILKNLLITLEHLDY
jgi:nucleotidyltransferase substrate binding protein (TIGR01987 family)